MTSRIIALLCATVAAVIAAMPAAAEDSVKLAYVDPLSGGGASIGEVGLNVIVRPPRPRAARIERMTGHRQHSPAVLVEELDRGMSDTPAGTGEQHCFLWCGHQRITSL